MKSKSQMAVHERGWKSGESVHHEKQGGRNAQ